MGNPDTDGDGIDDANDIDDDNDGITDTIERGIDFSDVDNFLKFVGSARKIGPKEVQLTPEEDHKAGTVM